VRTITKWLINGLSLLAAAQVGISRFFLPDEVHGGEGGTLVGAVAEGLLVRLTARAPVIRTTMLHRYLVGGSLRALRLDLINYLR
jgi:hypothetical protein